MNILELLGITIIPQPIGAPTMRISYTDIEDGKAFIIYADKNYYLYVPSKGMHWGPYDVLSMPIAVYRTIVPNKLETTVNQQAEHLSLEPWHKGELTELTTAAFIEYFRTPQPAAVPKDEKPEPPTIHSAYALMLSAAAALTEIINAPSLATTEGWLQKVARLRDDLDQAIETRLQTLAIPTAGKPQDQEAKGPTSPEGS